MLITELFKKSDNWIEKAQEYFEIGQIVIETQYMFPIRGELVGYGEEGKKDIAYIRIEDTNQIKEVFLLWIVPSCSLDKFWKNKKVLEKFKTMRNKKGIENLFL